MLKLKCLFLVPLIGFSQIVAKELPNEHKGDAGFVLVMLLNSISNLGTWQCDSIEESIKLQWEKYRAIDCLAEIKSDNSFCHTLVNHFERCSKELVQTVETCVKPKEKGLATAFVSALVAQAEVICDSDGEHMFELLNPCIYRTLKGNNKGCVNGIVEDIIAIRDDSNDDKILKGLCWATSKAKKCFSDPFRDQCTNEVTRSMVRQLYNAGTKPCKDYLKD